MAVIKGGFEIVKRAMLKELMKRGDDGIMLTLPKNELVDLNARITMDRLIKAGIDPESLTSPDQVLNVLENINNQMMKNTKVLSGDEAAKFLNKAFPKKGEVVKFPQKRSFKEEIEAMKKSGDLVDEDNMVISEKITDREMFKDASKRFNKKETEAEIAARMNKENKESAQRIRNKKMVDDAIDNASPGFAGDRKYDAQLVADDLAEKRFGKEFYDLDEIDQMELYDEAYQGLTKKKFDPPEDMAKGGRAGHYTGGMVDVEPSLSDIGHGSDALMARTRLVSPGSQSTTSTGLNYLLAEDNDNIRVPFGSGKTVYDRTSFEHKINELKAAFKHYKRGSATGGRQGVMTFEQFAPLYAKENFAEGGRTGFSSGGMGRRAFLKLMAALGGTTAAFKTGILGLGEGAGKKAVTETIKKSAGSGQPPPYFFELMETITKNGREIKSYGERVKQTVAPSKDGKSELLMTEDLNTGSVQIKKIHKEGDDMVTKSEEMTYTKNMGDESTQGKPPDDYEEVTEFNSRIYKDEFNEPDFVDGIDVESIIKEVDVKKADGGRIDFMGGGLANVLSRLGIKGSSRRFLEKAFGKENFENMIKNDPDMHRGLLEVVEMFRNRDKEGLKMYMQKFLPHMDDATVEEFIVGTTPDIEGLSGQLTRLGSGRDYAQKLQMMKKADEVKKLENFDIKNVSKNAEGGRIGFSGGGIFRAIIAKAAAAKGLKPYEFIKVTSYKSLPPEVKMFLSADDFAKLKSGQKDMYSNYIDMAKTRKDFQQQVEAGKTTPAKPLFENMEKTMDKQSYVPKTVTADDIAEMELMVKNRFNKGRKDNALGGLQTMLGE
jgi:hypothetical protein